MDWLNYHHLYYFSIIAQEGGVTPAARQLRISHSTLSTQLRTLESHLGAPLFERQGKRLVLTALGVETAGYAADIFRLGRELLDVAQGRRHAGREVLRIGVVASIPKTMAQHLLAPAIDAEEEGTTYVRQDASARLIEALDAGQLHVVLTNDLAATSMARRLHAHLLGEAAIMLYARPDLARALKRRFPASLHGAPLVLPPLESPLRRRLDEWFAERHVEVAVRAEIEDAGLLRAFGGAGRGVIPVRAALRTEVEDLRNLQLVGRCSGVRERYYAITTDRRLTHPAVAALVESARGELHPPITALPTRLRSSPLAGPRRPRTRT